MNKHARSIGQRKRSNLQSMGTEEDKGIENIFNKIIKDNFSTQSIETLIGINIEPYV